MKIGFLPPCSPSKGISAQQPSAMAPPQLRSQRSCAPATSRRPVLGKQTPALEATLARRRRGPRPKHCGDHNPCLLLPPASSFARDVLHSFFFIVRRALSAAFEETALKSQFALHLFQPGSGCRRRGRLCPDQRRRRGVVFPRGRVVGFRRRGSGGRGGGGGLQMVWRRRRGKDAAGVGVRREGGTQRYHIARMLVCAFSIKIERYVTLYKPYYHLWSRSWVMRVLPGRWGSAKLR